MSQVASDTTVSANRLVTADELLAMGTDFHGELIRGRLIEMAPAGWNHGNVANGAAFLVTRFVRVKKLGKVFAAETGFKLERDPDTVRAPDVAFVRADRIPTAGSRSGFFDGPPDLAVEVNSPDDRPAAIAAKVATWLDAGAIEVWVIDPRSQTLAVHTGANAVRVYESTNTFADSKVLPGFSEPIAAFFE